MSDESSISLEFFVSDHNELTKYVLRISEPESENQEHFCRVSLSPFLVGEKRKFGADKAQAAILSRELIRSLLRGKVLTHGVGDEEFDVDRLLARR